MSYRRHPQKIPRGYRWRSPRQWAEIRLTRIANPQLNDVQIGSMYGLSPNIIGQRLGRRRALGLPIHSGRPKNVSAPVSPGA